MSVILPAESLNFRNHGKEPAPVRARPKGDAGKQGLHDYPFLGTKGA